MKISQILELRRLEVWAASGAFVYGVATILPWDSMASPAYSSLTTMLPEAVWGLLFLTGGLAHFFALAINGRRWWTPIVRCFMSLLTLSLYMTFALGFAVVNAQSGAVVSFLIGASAHALCLLYALRDAKQAMKVGHAISFDAR